MDGCPECLELEIAIWKLAAELAATKTHIQASRGERGTERDGNLAAALELSHGLELKRQELTKHLRTH